MPIASDPFIALVGSAFVHAASAADTVRGMAPEWIVEPGNPDELAAVLREASRLQLAVIPRGGGTKLEWGNPPARAHIVVSTARVNAILEHVWADLTVTVQAGCTIERLQTVLAEHGQRVAVDPLWPSRATVGGILSANDTGSWRLRFGGLRDLVIGTTLALADGTVASSGGKVVKNVAGYDLSKLATGALGTLGVITSATFRLHPISRVCRTISTTLEDVANAQRLIDALQDSTLTPTAIQMRTSAGNSPHVDVLFESSEAGVAAQIRQTDEIAQPLRFEHASALVWQARENLWSASDIVAIAKISVAPAELANTVDVVERVAADAGMRTDIVFEATGIGWACFTGSSARWPEVLHRLRTDLVSNGGSVLVLRSPVSEAEHVDSWGDTGAAQSLMQAVKRQFDPGSTLNPGRFVGGI